MIDAQTYLEHLKRDGEHIAHVADGHLDEPVPSTPGNTVGSLLLHVAGVCLFWSEALVQNKFPDIDWASFGTDTLTGYKVAHARVVDELRGRDPDQPTWTWGADQRVAFAYRRIAQELAIHRWDFENAVGKPLPIDATLAADGIDEFLFVFGPKSRDENFKGASERFAGSGEVFRLQANDVPSTITFRALADRFELVDREPDVTTRGSASDLLLFLWGRVPPSVLEVSGNASLLERWQDRVKI